MGFSLLSGSIATTSGFGAANGFILPSQVEAALGFPLVDGQILASTVSGRRYWTNSANLENIDTDTINARNIRVTGELNLDDASIRNTASRTTTNTAPITLFSYDIGLYDTCDALIRATSNNKIHITKLLVTSNTTTAIATEYGTLQTGDALFTVDVDFVTTSTRILITPASSASTVFKSSYELITSTSPGFIEEGLILYLDAADPTSYVGTTETVLVSDKTFGTWIPSGSPVIISTTEVAPDFTNTATTFSDQSATQYSSFYKTINISPLYQYYTCSVYIKKTTGGTAAIAGFTIAVLNNTTQITTASVLVNTDTGQFIGGNASVTSEGAYWKVSRSFYNTYGANGLRMIIYAAYRPSLTPAVNDPATTGQVTIWGAEIKSAPVWYDLSGLKNHGILFNGITYSAGNGGGMVFDGVDSYIDLGTGIQLSDNFTVEFWHKNINTTGMLLDQGNLNTDSTGRFEMDSRGLRVRPNNYNFEGTPIATGNYPDPTGWNTVTFTFGGGIAKFYINGVLDTTFNSNFSFFSPGSSILKIGRTAGASARVLSGTVSAVKIYDRVLDEIEVGANYNALRGRYGLS